MVFKVYTVLNVSFAVFTIGISKARATMPGKINNNQIVQKINNAFRKVYIEHL